MFFEIGILVKKIACGELNILQVIFIFELFDDFILLPLIYTAIDFSIFKILVI